MLSPRHEGFIFILFKSPANTDIFATQYSQQPYTAPLFSLWLCVSIAVASSRQYNENYYH
ncbi:hypothetical protein AB60_0753 [Escherichia coli 2-156-04_S1_C3]|nr:hypothetical protein Ec53638_0551 [Escherichia coli 53638]EFW72736.1 hypothetical protein ECoL_04488 [Escherichia coli EC4100B]EHW82627.1 hypothetical protein ECDEC10D_0911 [Escherichia coli DEC10D]EMW36005.1 hypothetical protein EC2845350_0839 [Escherichia coli 2845350]ENA21348.1 hypothetical protein ECP02989421_1310 [Escherichia coli P0298942.1]ENB65818.1 hypothetical protein ECP029894215_0824 [Escherichia coli P0298942.15]END74121.1 hypothetical protein ECP02989423_0851 [Escherichia col